MYSEHTTIAPSIEQPAGDDHIVRTANTLLQEAIDARATEVSLQPDTAGLQIRFTIDGVVHVRTPIVKSLQDPLMQRYCEMAEIPSEGLRSDLREGFVGIGYNGGKYNVRVRLMRTVYGDKLTMQIASHVGG